MGNGNTSSESRGSWQRPFAKSVLPFHSVPTLEHRRSVGSRLPSALSDKTSFLPFPALSQPPPALLQRWTIICVWPLSHHSQDQKGFYFFFLLLSRLSFFSKYHSLSSALGYICSLIFYFKTFYWCIVDLQCCLSSRWTAKWISYTFIYSFLDSFPI